MRARSRLGVFALVALIGCGDEPVRAVDSAREVGSKAASDLRAGPDGRGTADSLLTSAAGLYERGAYDSARTTYRTALTAASALGDSVAIARSLTWIGLASWRLADYVEARRLGERALAIKHRIGARADLFRSYNALGLLSRDEGRPGDALAMFDSALAMAVEFNDRLNVAKAGSNRALVAYDLGELDTARPGFISARDVARQVGDLITEWNAVVGLASVEVRLGDPLGAIDGVQELRRRHPNPKHPVGEENAYGQLGTAYDLLGEPQRAIAALDSALRIARASELREQEAEDLKLLAEVYEQIGDRRRALGLLETAYAIDSTIDAPGEIADVLLRRAAILGELGDGVSARASAARALTIHRGLNAKFDVISDLVVGAELEARAGDWAAAHAGLVTATRLADSLHVRPAQYAVALSTARVADREGDARRVLAVLDSAKIFRALGARPPDWEADALTARAHRRLGHRALAIERGQRAVAGLERIRRSLGAGELRTALVASRADVFGDLVLALLEAGRTSDALEVADRSRSRALLDHLGDARLNDSDTATASMVMTERARLLTRIDALLRRLSMTDGRPRERGKFAIDNESAVATELASLRREFDELSVRFPGNRGPTALRGVETVDVKAVRGALGGDEALLEFFVTPERTFVFVVRKANVRVVATDLRYDDLVGRVRLARDLLAQADQSDASAAASGDAVLRRLYDALILPVFNSGALTGARRLIVVPHGMLVYLPFAALRSPSGRSLIEDFTLSYLPVAAALPVLRAEMGRRRSRSRVVAFAPFPFTLTASREEARHAAGKTTGSTSLEGPLATERALRSALQEGAVIHVASHGIMETESPMFSRIELARGSGAPSDDGRLEVHELLSLRITSPLVFLSGCETGAGVAWSSPYARTSDHATLEQAFLYAGASTVIATRWSIEDASAAAVADRFYTYLAAHDPAEALALAQRDMIRAGRFQRPHYWAAYAVSGSAMLPAAGIVSPRDGPSGVLTGSPARRPTIQATRAVSLMSKPLVRQ